MGVWYAFLFCRWTWIWSMSFQRLQRQGSSWSRYMDLDMSACIIWVIHATWLASCRWAALACIFCVQNFALGDFSVACYCRMLVILLHSCWTICFQPNLCVIDVLVATNCTGLAMMFVFYFFFSTFLIGSSNKRMRWRLIRKCNVSLYHMHNSIATVALV